MTYVLIQDGVVFHCVSVDDLAGLQECYPDALIMERTGEENIGWLFDGTNFTEQKD